MKITDPFIAFSWPHATVPACPFLSKYAESQAINELHKAVTLMMAGVLSNREMFELDHVSREDCLQSMAHSLCTCLRLMGYPSSDVEHNLAVKLADLSAQGINVSAHGRSRRVEHIGDTEDEDFEKRFDSFDQAYEFAFELLETKVKGVAPSL